MEKIIIEEKTNNTGIYLIHNSDNSYDLYKSDKVLYQSINEEQIELLRVLFNLSEEDSTYLSHNKFKKEISNLIKIIDHSRVKIENKTTNKKSDHVFYMPFHIGDGLSTSLALFRKLEQKSEIAQVESNHIVYLDYDSSKHESFEGYVYNLMVNLPLYYAYNVANTFSDENKQLLDSKLKEKDIDKEKIFRCLDSYALADGLSPNDFVTRHLTRVFRCYNEIEYISPYYNDIDKVDFLLKIASSTLDEIINISELDKLKNYVLHFNDISVFKYINILGGPNLRLSNVVVNYSRYMESNFIRNRIHQQIKKK